MTNHLDFLISEFEQQPASMLVAPGISIKRTPIDWALLARDRPPPRPWYINEWLGPHAVLFGGPGGIGKSLLVQQMATALALGRSFIGSVRRPVNVLYWSCEDDEDEVWRRQVDICAYFGVGLDALVHKLVIYCGVGQDNTLYGMIGGVLRPTRLLSELEQQIHDHGADVVVLDNVAQVYGGSENDRHQVTRFVNAVRGAHRDRPGADIFLVHPAKNEASQYSGSTAWHNLARTRWWMSNRMPGHSVDDEDQQPRRSDSMLRFLSKEKSNYGELDYRSFVLRNGVLVPQELELEGKTASISAEERKSKAEVVVLDAVRKLWAMDQTMSSSPGATYLPALARKFEFDQGVGKKDLEGAMRRLLIKGKLRKQEVGKHANRTPRISLVIVDDTD